jgi:ubiquinone/menaquinone biosynthesis C-methylase UbiE
MNNDIATHYSGSDDLVTSIRNALKTAGKDVDRLTTQDMATVDEFHIRGRGATLELADRMELSADAHVLDLGSGLGGPARTLAETYGCRVTGIDLTESFCVAAAEISGWLKLSDKLRFVHGDATDMPFDPESFDGAMTIHAAMNVADKKGFYRSAKKALKPGRIFAVYDVLQGEGGPVHFPVP